MFSQPTSGGGFFKPRDHEGHLVLITRLVGMDRHFDSMKGAEIDRATVDIVDLDGDGELAERVWITHAGLVNKISSHGPTLGRVGEVQFSKGKGFSLLPYREGPDDAKAAEWLRNHPDVPIAPVDGATTVKPAEPAASTVPMGGGQARTMMTLDGMRQSGNTTSGNPMSEDQLKAALAALEQQKLFADTPLPF